MKIIKYLLTLFISISAFGQTYDFSAIDKLLQDSLPIIQGTGKGCSLLLIKDGKVIYDKGFGSNYDNQKLVPIASASKWLSAGVIIGLLDQNSLSLDDSAGKHLSYLSDDKKTMTFRQMYSHTAGFLQGDNVDDTILSQKGIDLDSCVRNINKCPLSFISGKAFAYGGYSMQVAARCAEVASGIKMKSGDAWKALFNLYVCDKIGMKATFDLLNNNDNPRVAGGAITSAQEYAKYLQMILNKGVYNGKRIFSENAIAELIKNQTGAVPILYSPYQGMKLLYPYIKSDIRYGLGNWREVLDDKDNLLESSSQGAFGFSPWIDYNRKLVGVLSIFSELKDVYPTYYKMKALIRQILDNPVSVSDEVSSSLITIGPNPAEDFILINNANVKSFSIYNELGAVQLTGENSYADISSLNSGMYFIRIETTEAIVNMKFIKK